MEPTRPAEDTLDSGFTLGLALYDAVPVVLFCVVCCQISALIGSIPFLIGAILCAVSGLLKVTWTIIVATRGKDVPILNKQLRILMPVGFVTMLLAFIFDHGALTWGQIWGAFLGFPAVIFLILGLLGLVGMGVCGAKLDSTKSHSSWIEQSVNTFAQIMFIIGFALI